MKTWLSELRFSGRMIRRYPLSMAVVVITLGLGIGANTAVLSVVNAVLRRPLPFPDVERLVLVLTSRPKEGIEYEAVSYPNFRDWQRENTVFSDIEAVSTTRTFTLTGDDRAESLNGEFVSAGFFPMMGVEVIEGRTFLEEEDSRPGADPVVVISEALWRRRYGSDPDLVGQTIQLNSIPFTVVGIMSSSYRGVMWDPVDVWVPMMMAATLLDDPNDPRYLTQRYWNWFLSVARLKPGVTPDQAWDSMNTLTDGQERQYPKANEGRRAWVRPLTRFYFPEELRKRLQFLTFAAGLVLLLCCVNVASIVLTHLVARQREIAIRTAMGSSRLRLMRLLATQTVTVSLVGGGLGIALTYALTERLVGLSDIRPASFVNVYVDPGIVATAFVLSLVTGLVFGVLPAVLAPDKLQEALKEGYRGSSSGAGLGGRLRGPLVVVQVALAIAFVVMSSLLIARFHELRDGDAGFRTERVLTAELDLPSQRYDKARVQEFSTRLYDTAKALPGVEDVGIIGPLSPPFADRTMDILIEERLQESDDAATFRVYRHAVFPGYFAALQITVLEGRDFTRGDTWDFTSEGSGSTPSVAVISYSLAERVWPGEDPARSALHKRFRLKMVDTETPWITVVGVVPTARNRGLDSRPELDVDVYFPLLQDPVHNLKLLIPTTGEPAGVAPALRRAVATLDPDLPLYGIQSLRQRFTLRAADHRFLSALATLFSIIAVTLATVGTYGITSFMVGQRRQEFGIRLAMGASPPEVLLLALRGGVVWLAWGFALGVPLVFMAHWYAGQLLDDLGPLSPVHFLIAVPLAAVAVLAALIPARRATRVNPVEALRQE